MTPFANEPQVVTVQRPRSMSRDISSTPNDIQASVYILGMYLPQELLSKAFVAKN